MEQTTITIPTRYREIRLASRPEGSPTLENFELTDVDLAPPGPGEVQIRNLWMSVDPYMCGRMMARESYVPRFESASRCKVERLAR